MQVFRLFAWNKARFPPLGNRRDRPGDLNLRAAAAGKIFKNAGPDEKSAHVQPRAISLPLLLFLASYYRCAPRSSRLRFMRFSQPKQIVKTPGGVQSHACYRKINDISIGDFSLTPTTAPPSTRSCNRRRILCFYDEFPYLISLSIADIFNY